MNEQDNENSLAFMEATSRKFEEQEKKIGLLEEKMNQSPDNSEILQEVHASLDNLRTEMKASHFPTEKIKDLSSQLDLAIGILRKPINNEVQHHHHIPKLLWVTSGLFIILSLVCAGWYNTSGKLVEYIASDTKYRFLRLDTSKRQLQYYLDQVDNLNDAHPDLRKYVIKTEAKYKQNIERLLQASRFKAEAKALEKEAREK